jgi:hypothetical protein
MAKAWEKVLARPVEEPVTVNDQGPEERLRAVLDGLRREFAQRGDVLRLCDAVEGRLSEGATVDEVLDGRREALLAIVDELADLHRVLTGQELENVGKQILRPDLAPRTPVDDVSDSGALITES